MEATINGVYYNTKDALPFNDYCLGRTKSGYLYQILLVTPREDYFMILAMFPENVQPCLPNLRDAEIFALTKEEAIGRYESRFCGACKGDFNKYEARSIQEFLAGEYV